MNIIKDVIFSASQRPELHNDEKEIMHKEGISYEISNNYSSKYKNGSDGMIILTTHRLIWVGFEKHTHSHQHENKKKKKEEEQEKAKRIGFYINFSDLDEDFKEIEGGHFNFLFRAKMIVNEGNLAFIFTGRNGGVSCKDFVKKSNNYLHKKLWISKDNETTTTATTTTTTKSPLIVGVGGLLKRQEEKSQVVNSKVSHAFTDLKNLMSEAEEMVIYAENLRKTFSKTNNNDNSSVNDDNDNKEYSNFLLELGVVNPVTKLTTGSHYHEELARQISDWLISKNILENNGGMLSLIDLFCLYNRARGTDLISPNDLYTACNLAEYLGLPICLKKFDNSGVLIVQLRRACDFDLASEISKWINESGPKDINDVASKLNISLILANELLLLGEKMELFCRDETINGILFYPYIF